MAPPGHGLAAATCRPSCWGNASMSVRLLRKPTPGTAFVLGGGGNLGAVQVGMLQALFEAGIVPEVVIGCSVGALNAAGLAADPTLAGVRKMREARLNPDGHAAV